MQYACMIVDDEELSRNYIADLLAEFWPEARIAGSFNSTASAKKILQEEDIHVLFLDIKMPGENGLEFLDNIKMEKAPKVVFITAYKQYALPAIKHQAFDYLLKPVDRQEFAATITRLKKELQATIKIEGDPRFLDERYLKQKLTVNHNAGFKVITLEDIVHLTASNNYTVIHLVNKSTLLVSKTLKDFEMKLQEPWFFRVHKSHIINMHYFDEYVTENGGYVLLKNGEKILLSKYRMTDFINLIRQFTNGLKT